MNTDKRQKRNPKRFWAKVKKLGQNNCWIWLAATNGCGYGIFYANGRNYQAHRFSMQLYLNRELKGSKQLTKDDELVLHKCNDRSCVNPNHLYLGTQKDNIKDRDRQGRQSKGEHRYNHKLTTNAVKRIRKLYKKYGKHNLVVLAKEYHVHPSTISAVVKNKGWKHV